ncbi:MAG: hypothetical protein QXG05_01555 [Nitrososphaerota archaeon]
MKPSISAFYAPKVEMPRFLLFGVLVVIGSLFFIMLIEIKSRHD